MKTLSKILLAAAFAFTSATTFAQSQQHVVQKGESIYGIARKYNVAPNDLIKANPKIGNGEKILVGQVLAIPDKAAQPTTAQSQHATPTTVAPTKPTTTQPTQSTQSTQVTAKPVAQQQQANYLKPKGYKEMYKIQKKDNLTSIAQKFGVTVEDLLEVNPGLTINSKIKKDEFLFIPYTRAEKQAESNRLAAEKAAAEKAAAEKKAAEEAKLAKKNSINVAIVLPLKNGGDLGRKMIEFYRGVLMAADSVKHEGTSISMHAYHCGTTLEEIKAITAKPEMKSMDIIIGPVNEVQSTSLNEFCKENKIHLVMPFATSNMVGLTTPTTYHASNSSDNARKYGVKFAATRFNNANYIIVQTGLTDDRGTTFTNDLKEMLTSRGITAKTVKMNSDNATYAAAFDRTKNNIFIPDASSLSATRALTKKLIAVEKANPDYKFSLFGYPEWPTYTSSLPQDFHTLNTYVYSPFYYDTEDSKTKHFEAQYKNKFKVDIFHSYPRYGAYGFDLAYYFMHGMANLGNTFDEKQSTLKYEPLQNPMRYEQKGENACFSNEQVYIVHYTPNQKVEIVK